MITKVPAIPDVPLDPLSPETLRAILTAIKQVIETREGIVAGGTNSRFVTLEDLRKTGLVLPNGLPK